MAVKAFASERAGPLALLKVFTSFFSGKEEGDQEVGERIWGQQVPLLAQHL